MLTIGNRREAEILAALASSASALTPEQLVDQIYVGLPTPLKGAASESVLSHLVKLRDEGTVFDQDGSLGPGRLKPQAMSPLGKIRHD